MLTQIHNDAIARTTATRDESPVTVDGQLDEVGRKHGRWLDLTIMQLRLDRATMDR